MAQIAHVVVTLPALPDHFLPHSSRNIEVVGGITPVPASVPIDTKTIELDCDLNGSLTVRVSNVLSTGHVSDPCEITFTPHDRIKAKPSNPDDFSVEVTGITGEPDAPAA